MQHPSHMITNGIATAFKTKTQTPMYYLVNSHDRLNIKIQNSIKPSIVK